VGLRLVREIGGQMPLASFTTGEISPCPDCRSDAPIDAHIRATAITVHHPLGTCKMELRRDRRLL
jgi:choline dehydrogenase-like flavoprotein